MIALPSPSPSPSQALFPTLAWSFESPYHQHHESTQTSVLGDFNDHASTSHHLLHLPQQMLELGHEIPATSTTHDTSNNGDCTTVMKKLHHNASERDRRKKMNTLYSSLRSLLPVPDQMKKLSIPSTVARVVKYIPELQQEVQKLITKKEKLLSKIAKQEVHDNLKIHRQNQTKQTKNVSMSTISLNRLGNGDVVIQIPAQKGQDCPLMSELLLNLEEEGLLLLNASSVDSSGGTLLFYNLHFKVKENDRLDREKLISMLGKKERVFPRDGIMQQLDYDH